MSTRVANNGQLEKTVSAADTDYNSHGHHNGSGANLNGANLNGGNLGRQLSIQLTPEQFEQLYLQPGGQGASRQTDLIKRFGNPTVLGLASFLICLSPLSCYLLSFRGTNPTTTPIILTGTFFFTGGVGMYIASILEWIVGNTFSFVTFALYGSFFLGFGYLNGPAYQVVASFETSLAAATNLYEGLGLWLIWWAVLTFIFLVCSIPTNVPFVGLFIALEFNFIFAAAGYWKLAQGSAVLGEKLIKVGGGFALAAALFGWYIFFAVMLLANNAPFALPLFDISHFFVKKPKEEAHRV